jgi:hypothetical protein
LVCLPNDQQLSLTRPFRRDFSGEFFYPRLWPHFEFVAYDAVLRGWWISLVPPAMAWLVRPR